MTRIDLKVGGGGGGRLVGERAIVGIEPFMSSETLAKIKEHHLREDVKEQ